MRSFGCQLFVFYYLSELEVLRLQCIDRDTYGRTIARCQETFRIRNEMIAFTFQERRFKKSIFLLNSVTGEAKKFRDDRFDFKATRTVVVKNELYAFKEGCPVSVYKIANFTSNDHLVTDLSTLPFDEYLRNFSFSYWAAAGSIVLTAGLANREVTAQTFLLAVQTGRWEQRSFPALNVARHLHASLTLDKQAYVACGRGPRDLRSVEMLRMGAQAWELIDIPDLTPRFIPVFSQIDADNIAILGGCSDR